MASFFRRLLRRLGFKRSSRRKPSRVDSRYTYERDEKGRLIRRGPNGVVERLDYETWHPIEASESRRSRKRREKLEKAQRLDDRDAETPSPRSDVPDFRPPSTSGLSTDPEIGPAGH